MNRAKVNSGGVRRNLNKSRFLFFAIFYLSLFLLSGSFVFAYNYSGYRWSGTSVNYYINSGTATLGWGSAINSADTTWDNAGSRFRFNYMGTTSRNVSLPSGSADGYNVVGYRPMGSTGDIATTSLYYPSGNLREVDTAFNTDYAFRTDGNSCCFDVQNTATHEFGHWLALNHSSYWCGYSWEATMCRSASAGETRKQTLSSDDRNGIIAIYGR